MNSLTVSPIMVLLISETRYLSDLTHVGQNVSQLHQPSHEQFAEWCKNDHKMNKNDQ